MAYQNHIRPFALAPALAASEAPLKVKNQEHYI